MGHYKHASPKLFLVALLFGTLFAMGTFGQGTSRFFRSGLSINPSAVNFGSLNVGAISSAIGITFTNQGFSNITITSVNVSLSQVTYSGPALPATLAPGQTVRAALIFVPTAAQSYSGSLQVIESNGRSASARMTGTGVAVQAQSSTSGSSSVSTSGSTSSSTTSGSTSSVSTSGSTSSLASGSAQLHLSSLTAAFNNTYVGNSLGQFITVSNTGSASFTILNVSLSGAGFSVTGISSGQILAPGQSAVLEVIFLPLTNGILSGGVSITTDVAGSATIACSGSAGSSGSTGTVASTGSGSSTGSTTSTSSTTSTGSTSAGGSTDGASSSANSTGSLTIHSVVLTWNESSSSSVIGYNVYRSMTEGAEAGTAPVNGGTLVTGNSYTDTNIASGTTYYYAVTAVGSDDVQSTDSNETSAATP